MRTKLRVLKSTQRIQGFSLVELMIGILVGLIVALAIIQSLSLFDRQKQTTSAGSEAQENGLISMALLEQDIHNAGSGLADTTPYDCANYYSYYNDGTTETSPLIVNGNEFNITPLAITDSANGAASDSITVQYAGNFLGTLPAFLSASATSADNPYLASRVFGYAAGDMVLAVQGANCTLARVSGTDATLFTIQHAATATPNFNQTTAPVDWPLYTAGAKLFNLGRFVSHTYSVNGGNLQVAETTLGPTGMVTTTTPLVSNVVNLQAQYGIANAGTTTVAQWVDATAGTSWATPSASDIKRIMAVRIAVVARSTKMEPGNVTAPCTAGATGPCAWTGTGVPAIDLSSDPNWKRYRYKIYQTIIPLRNVIWTFS
jgi:type IV pilus assembly protein PilW